MRRRLLTTREHVIALEPRGKGIVGTLLRYPYEVRNADDYFDDIPDEKIPKDMLDLAKHIVQTKAGHFEPDKFEDHYETALKELLKKKAAGENIEIEKTRAPANVVNLMDALKRSIDAEKARPPERAPAKRRAAAHERRAPAKRASPENGGLDG